MKDLRNQTSTKALTIALAKKFDPYLLKTLRKELNKVTAESRLCNSIIIIKKKRSRLNPSPRTVSSLSNSSSAADLGFEEGFEDVAEDAVNYVNEQDFTDISDIYSVASPRSKVSEDSSSDTSIENPSNQVSPSLDTQNWTEKEVGNQTFRSGILATY